MAIDHVVRPGDCISSLAESHGLFWETVWNHPGNAALRRQRANPNILRPGDVVHLPDKRRHVEDGASDQLHRFVKKGVPAQFRLRLTRLEPPPGTTPRNGAPSTPPVHLVLEDPAEKPAWVEMPRKHTRYLLTIEGISTTGTTDGDGYLQATIPPTAKTGSVTVDAGTQDEMTIPLQFGHLDPLDEIAGVKQRLANLGFDCGDTTAQVHDNFRAALRAFQQFQGLDVTGEVDAPTRDRLLEAHGS